tara:strand:+ start:7834 stop:8367 length:534 start_codon:yes stop_codon:yes gene_type:complete
MSFQTDDDWTVVGAKNKAKIAKKKARKAQKQKQNVNNSRINQAPDNSPSGAASASFNQGSHFIPFDRNNKTVQDWDGKVFRNKQKPQTTKEHRHKRTVDESKHLAKLENETETFRHKKVSHELRKKMTDYRSSHKMTQKDLALKLNLHLDIIKSYENGSAIPDNKVITQINRLIRQV